MNKKFLALIICITITITVLLLCIPTFLKEPQQMSTTIETSPPYTTTVPLTVEETQTEAPTYPIETDTDYTREIDFNSLQEINSDIIAWIYVPGTQIDYPVLWREYDISYYLTRNMYHEKSYDGVFLDGYSNADFTTLHNIIYGHHMRNGTMFTDVTKFKKEDFFKEHRTVYIYTPDHTYRLKTIAAVYSDSKPIRRLTTFRDLTHLNTYLDEMSINCTFRDIPDEPINKLFSLITCSYEGEDTRTILYCYELDLDDTPMEYDIEGMDFGEGHR